MKISYMTNYVFNICVIYKLVGEIKNIFRSENSLKSKWEWFLQMTDLIQIADEKLMEQDTM